MKTIENYLAETKRFDWGNGRFLAYLDLGDRNGRPLFFFHGLPGSRVEAIALHKSAQLHGYRLIAPDRPGFGMSDTQPERRLLDWPPIVAVLADDLGIDTFGVIGTSGGGPFGLACAYAIPERLDFVVDIAGSAPLYTDAVACRELSSVDRFFTLLGSYLPAAFMRPPFAYMAYRLRKMTHGSQFVKLFGNAISESDRRVVMEEKENVRWENGRLLIRDVQESFRQGTQAVTEETMLNYKPWGFALSDINMPVHLFHGTEDKLVPFSFGEYKASHLPHAIFNPLHGKGHFYLLLNAAELFNYLQKKIYS